MIFLCALLLPLFSTALCQVKDGIVCPCGTTGTNFTTFPEKELQSDPCSRFRNCDTCRDNLDSCLSCPEGYYGTFCTKLLNFNVDDRFVNTSLLGEVILRRKKRHHKCPDLKESDNLDISCVIGPLERECKGTCASGYHFQNQRASELTFKCKNGKWTPIASFPPCVSGNIYSTVHCDLEIVKPGMFNCTPSSPSVACDVICYGHFAGQFTCIKGSGWTSKLPDCIRPKGENEDDNPAGDDYEEKSFCNDPGHVENGHRHEDAPENGLYEDGFKMIFMCDDGYVMSGPSTLTCDDEGFWSSGRPTCRRSGSTPPRGTPSHGSHGTPSRPLPPKKPPQGCRCQNGGRCSQWTNRCICPNRFHGELCEHDMSSACKCQNGGRCDQRTRRCICPKNFHGERCEHDMTPACNCQNGGTCNPTTGQCECSDRFSGDFCEYDDYFEEATCKDPGRISNGYRQDNNQNFNVGSMVVYSCRRGYRLSGSSTLTCLDTGEWSSKAPICRHGTAPPARPPSRKTCSDPGEIAHGSKVTDATYFGTGSVVSYDCKSGYAVQGSSELICNPDGTWSAKTPVCRVVVDRDENVEFCPHLTLPSNTEVRLRYPTGAESAWSTKLPIIPESENGYPVGYKIRYRCRSSLFEFHGSEYQTCYPSGSWGGTTPACIPTCGKSNVPKTPFLVNGSPTEEGQWPWQAAIFVKDSNGRFNFTCAGSLVSDKWIVTAAHCVTADSRSNQAMEVRRITVHVGRYNLSLKQERSAQIKQVRNINIHEDYDYVGLDSDIALIELETKVELTFTVKPICLPSDRSDVQPGKRGVVTGWGLPAKNRPSIILEQILVTVVTDRRCEENHKRLGNSFTVSKNMFCTESENKRSSSCSGDSGGPMMTLDETVDPNHWVLDGIISWGNHQGCQFSDEFTGFTKVSRFASWINYYI